MKKGQIVQCYNEAIYLVAELLTDCEPLAVPCSAAEAARVLTEGIIGREAREALEYLVEIDPEALIEEQIPEDIL